MFYRKLYIVWVLYYAYDEQQRKTIEFGVLEHVFMFVFALCGFSCLRLCVLDLIVSEHGGAYNGWV